MFRWQSLLVDDPTCTGSLCVCDLRLLAIIYRNNLWQEPIDPPQGWHDDDDESP